MTGHKHRLPMCDLKLPQLYEMCNYIKYVGCKCGNAIVNFKLIKSYNHVTKLCELKNVCKIMWTAFILPSEEAVKTRQTFSINEQVLRLL